MRVQLIVSVVLVSLHRRVLDCAFHAFDLAVGPGVVWLRQPVLNFIGLADHIEAHWSRIGRVPVAGLLGDLDAVIGENRLELVGHGFEQVLKELLSSAPVGLCNELGHSELAGVVDPDEEIERALDCLTSAMSRAIPESW